MRSITWVISLGKCISSLAAGVDEKKKKGKHLIC